MANNITIELCAEDRARIDRLTAALEKRTAQVDDLVARGVEVRTYENAEASEPAEEKPTETTQPEQEPTQEAEPVKTAPNKPTTTDKQVTIEDIRGKVLALTGAGKKDEVRAIIHEYASKVPDIPEDQRAEVLDKLMKLEG